MLSFYIIAGCVQGCGVKGWSESDRLMKWFRLEDRFMYKSGVVPLSYLTFS